MTWLSEWLKEIIFVVLIAVFLDLLLPNRSMERYVKFIVSLLILLTMLSPVMRLFAPDAKEKLEAAFSNSFSGLEEEGKHSTEVILQEGEELRKKREAEAMQWAGEEVARQMQAQIERETNQPVARVTVELEAEKVDNPGSAAGTEQQVQRPVVKKVEVVLAATPSGVPPDEPGRTTETPSGQPEEIRIAKVDKIEVEITPEATIADDSQPVVAEADTTKDPVLEAQIEGLLEREWGVQDGAVTVVMEEGQAEHKG